MAKLAVSRVQDLQDPDAQVAWARVEQVNGFGVKSKPSWTWVPKGTKVGDEFEIDPDQFERKKVMLTDEQGQPVMDEETGEQRFVFHLNDKAPEVAE